MKIDRWSPSARLGRAISGALLALSIGIVAMSEPGHAQTDDDVPGVDFELVVVDATSIALRVANTERPVGALDATISGFAIATGDDPCRIEGSGVCQPQSGGVAFVAFNVTGWDSGDTILVVSTATGANQGELGFTLHLLGDLQAEPMRAVLSKADGSDQRLTPEPRPEVGGAEVTTPAPTAPPVISAPAEPQAAPTATEPEAPLGTTEEGASPLPWVALVVAVVSLGTFVVLRRRDPH